jgi:hypothetical protein
MFRRINFPDVCRDSARLPGQPLQKPDHGAAFCVFNLFAPFRHQVGQQTLIET